MDKNSIAKQITKKSQMAIDKNKKSAGKKKKKSKKNLSSKNDPSPDSIEIEGVRAFETGIDSDSSSNRQQTSASPSLSQKPSVVPESERETTAKTNKSSQSNNDLKTEPPKKSSEEINTGVVYMKATHSSSYLSENNKKGSVSFSDFQEIQTISNNLSNMSVKSKNGSQRNKNKSSKSSSNGAKREKSDRSDRVRSEPLKSCINRAAEEAARRQSQESLRWEFTLENEDEEEERLRIYKINRRKRYLAAAHEKGLGWVVNYGKNGSPIAEETITENGERDTHVTMADFSPVRTILASQSSTPLGMGGEITC